MSGIYIAFRGFGSLGTLYYNLLGGKCESTREFWLTRLYNVMSAGRDFEYLAVVGCGSG
jgi:hypothetical protein